MKLKTSEMARLATLAILADLGFIAGILITGMIAFHAAIF
jgi:hypothetical protein